MAPSGAVNSYFPSKSVVVPTEVPFTITVTPGIAVPSSALVTVPVIVVCAYATCKPKNNMAARKIVNFLIIKKIWLIKNLVHIFIQ